MVSKLQESKLVGEKGLWKSNTDRIHTILNDDTHLVMGLTFPMM